MSTAPFSLCNTYLLASIDVAVYCCVLLCTANAFTEDDNPFADFRRAKIIRKDADGFHLVCSADHGELEVKTRPDGTHLHYADDQGMCQHRECARPVGECAYLGRL